MGRMKVFPEFPAKHLEDMARIYTLDGENVFLKIVYMMKIQLHVHIHTHVYINVYV